MVAGWSGAPALRRAPLCGEPAFPGSTQARPVYTRGHLRSVHWPRNRQAPAVVRAAAKSGGRGSFEGAQRPGAHRSRQAAARSPPCAVQAPRPTRAAGAAAVVTPLRVTPACCPRRARRGRCRRGERGGQGCRVSPRSCAGPRQAHAAGLAGHPRRERAERCKAVRASPHDAARPVGGRPAAAGGAGAHALHAEGGSKGWSAAGAGGGGVSPARKRNPRGCPAHSGGGGAVRGQQRKRRTTCRGRAHGGAPALPRRHPLPPPRPCRPAPAPAPPAPAGRLT